MTTKTFPASAPGAGACERAVMVGGGIGGLAAALSLRHAGCEISVLESAPALSEVDTGITLWSFAVRALRRLDLDTELASIGSPLERLISRDSAGQPLSELDLRPMTDALGAASYLVLCLRFAARRVPRHVLLEAWPGDPTPLKRLLDRRRASEAADATPTGPPP